MKSRLISLIAMIAVVALLVAFSAPQQNGRTTNSSSVIQGSEPAGGFAIGDSK